MHKLNQIVTATCALAAISSSASGQSPVDLYTGNFWLKQCTSKDASPQAACLGMVMAVDSYGMLLSKESPGSQFVFCRPGQVKIGQMKDIAVKYMEDNPARQHLMFVGLVTEAMQKAYPCKQ